MYNKKRIDGREENQLRPVQIIKDFILYPEGSVLIQMGNTKVICNATMEETVPPFKKDSMEGWVTAEYSMLPRATQVRTGRDINKLKQNARSVEIQRLIGRSIRTIVDFKALGERTIIVDCDVIQADGGTRTASITGAFVAVSLACRKLMEQGIIEKYPITGAVAAVSIGLKDGQTLLDLCYEEDKDTDVDMNIVMTESGEFIEIQGTGENRSFSKKDLDAMLAIAEAGIRELMMEQKKVLGEL